ncbi:hypothetical protein [Cognatiyoonia sp. IB215182]|uniref:hypothetical protein n=1 Tax=Cognatiyoonia sp. IB215182 TaxID=3097353 RepID=UPI002A0AF8B0|nr:hypothetical protein [Cognatiyoonia sp. IB215182]MDX8355237.1 hypothetical protein [Cognatiyoonia sp. IB215182]
MKAYCETCLYYRAARNLSDAVDMPYSRELAREIERSYDNQAQREVRDARDRNRQMQAGKQTWSRRPLASEYCGLREAQDIYYMCDAKNAGNRCNDHQEAGHGARGGPCQTCAHNVPPTGQDYDNQALLDAIDPSQNMYNRVWDNGAQPSQVTSNMDAIVSSNQQRRGLEMSLANRTGGILPDTPRYYAYCRHYSRPGAFVLGEMRNPDGNCPAYSGGGFHDDPYQQVLPPDEVGNAPLPQPRQPKSDTFRKLGRELYKEWLKK